MISTFGSPHSEDLSSGDIRSDGSQVEMEDSACSILHYYTDTWRFQAIKPIIWAMKACGLYIARDYNPNMPSSSLYKKTKVWITPSWVYSTVLLVFVWGEQVRFFSGFDSTNGYTPETFQKLVALIWSINMTFTFTEFYRACMVYTCVPEFFIFASCLKRRCDKFLRRKTLVVTTICLIAVLLNVAFTVYQTFILEDVLSINTIWPLTNSYSDQALVAMKILFIFSLTLRTSHWTIPAGMTIIISSLLKKEFSFIKEDLKTAINQGSLKRDLPKLRAQFQLVCKLVDHADDFLCRYLAFCILTSVAILILIIYYFIYWSETLSDSVVLATTVFWIIGTMLILIVVSYGTATVNTEAHSIFPTLHEIVLTEETSHLDIELTMFLQRLSGDNIGLTAWRMFVINRPTILTVTGMVVSYLVILVQSVPGGATVASCDFSSLLANISIMLNSTRAGL